MTKAQEVYERVEAMTASGTRKADAFRQLAEEYGQPMNSIRGAYYAHTRPRDPSSGGSRSSRDPIESAVIVLERAIAAIDGEIETAKNHTPPAAWENLVVTGRARSAIRRAARDAVRKQ